MNPIISPAAFSTPYFIANPFPLFISYPNTLTVFFLTDFALSNVLSAKPSTTTIISYLKSNEDRILSRLIISFTIVLSCLYAGTTKDKYLKLLISI